MENISSTGYYEEDNSSPRFVSFFAKLNGQNPGPGEWLFLVLFDDQIVLEDVWQNERTIENVVLPINFNEETSYELVANKPIIFLLRRPVGKMTKVLEPLQNPDNYAGGNVDLFSLVLGEEEIFINVPMKAIDTGLIISCAVEIRVCASGRSQIFKIPLIMTMLSAHCLPVAKEGTMYISGISLNDIHDPMAIKFGSSICTTITSNILWGSVGSTVSPSIASTAFSVPVEDKYVPQDLVIDDSDQCSSVYWNSMKRVLVEPSLLLSRLHSPFLVEVAGIPRMGKVEVRSRYMAFVDAGVLLEPGQSGVTVCAQLLLYNNLNVPDNITDILDLPPTSAKATVPENDIIIDEEGHGAYIIIRFDLLEPLVPKAKIISLFNIIGFPAPVGSSIPVESLEPETFSEDPPLDVKRIRKECGALTVHDELSGFASNTTLQMNQSIKRTAANHLLTRVRLTLKRFSPGDCPEIEYQDIITSQHSAMRKAVSASFAPQPPKPLLSSALTATRSRQAGDIKISNLHIERNLQIQPNNPRVLLSKVLRCLENRNDTEALTYLRRALNINSRNRYLLWIYGALQFDKGSEAYETAAAAFRIAVKSDLSDGATNTIGWAALHVLHHYNKNICAAFVAIKKMRKSHELPREWRKYLNRWIDASGEEEIFWIPGIIDPQNSMLIAAAFFLCLRCYKFSELILTCFERNCAVSGSCLNLKSLPQPDVYYIRAASLILRRQLDQALGVTDVGIRKFGPSGIMSQMRASCLICARGWDDLCETAFIEADRAGAEMCPALLLQAALGGMKSNLSISLQRAARAHKLAPSAHSALIIGRIYAKMGEEHMAERWVAAAVSLEPFLADGWALLAILAMYKKNIDKAYAMLRTAKQIGSLTPDIEAELQRVMKIIKIQDLPDSITTDLCFCDYLQSDEN